MKLNVNKKDIFLLLPEITNWDVSVLSTSTFKKIKGQKIRPFNRKWEDETK